jgi:SOS-response transcriptional repressor LexA
MEPRIPNGSYVVIQRDMPPNDGDIAVVRVASIGDDEYAIKRFYRRGDRVELRSINPAYSPMVYAASDVQSANRVVAYLPAPHIP